MNADKVAAAINATHIAEVIKINDGPTSIQIVHRVAKDHLSVWLGVVGQVLSRKQGWEDHICKRYFYQGGKIRYAWNFIAQWKSPKQKKDVLAQICKLFTHAAQEVPQIYHQLESYPLTGAKEGRNEPQGPRNPRAAGPMTGGVSQKGAHKL